MAEIDMTKPQPCTKYRDATQIEWIAKLAEETNEVVQEAKEMAELFENQCAVVDSEEMGAVQDRLALELTDVITICTSWLYALGYDEDMRGELQKRVNEKNKKRGWHDAAMQYRRHLQKPLYVQTCRNYVAQKNVRVHKEVR